MKLSQVATTLPTMDWDPWEHTDDIHFRLRPLPDWTGGAAYYQGDRGNLIVVDPRLEGPHRTEALAHELVHHERGLGAWDVAREEEAVDDEVARRLVPRRELLEHVRGRMALGEGTSPDDVADRFGVTVRVARRALALLYDETGGQL